MGCSHDTTSEPQTMDTITPPAACVSTTNKDQQVNPAASTATSCDHLAASATDHVLGNQGLCNNLINKLQYITQMVCINLISLLSIIFKRKMFEN